MDIVTTWKTQ